MKSFHVTTFGCQMNEHDSERMKGMLESLGYAEAPERGEADLILFNTCSIREKADDRFVAHLHEAKVLKRRDPGALDDDGAVLLSHEIAREIEKELEYPGQIKVTVIRESRAVEFAK